MSEELGTFFDRVDYGEYNPRELEAFAYGLWLADLMTGGCNHSKGYDPLRIDEEEGVARSYVFDMVDGGRHHKYEPESGYKSMIAQTAWRLWCNAKYKPSDAEKERYFVNWYNSKVDPKYPGGYLK